MTHTTRAGDECGYPAHACGTIRHEEGRASVPGVADWLGFAAAPTFAIMALLTGVLGGGQMMMCSTPDASPLSGMAVMYLLMSAFHSAPWVKLCSRAFRTRG